MSRPLASSGATTSATASPALSSQQPRTTAAGTATSGETPAAATTSQSLPPDVSHLLGSPITLKLTSGSTAHGLLWAHDTQLGVVVLETGVVTPSPIPEHAVSSPAPSRTSGSRASVAGKEIRTGFHIVKVRDIKSVSSSEAPSSSGLPSKISDIYPVNVAAAEAREKAAFRDGMARASRKGKGVSALAQDVYDALSKTLPCRWHEKHIIVLDEIVISAPAYDASSTTMPDLPADRLRALLDPSGTALETANKAEKDKVHSYNRVMKVLEGERKKILARQALSVPTSSSSPAPSSDVEAK